MKQNTTPYYIKRISVRIRRIKRAVIGKPKVIIHLPDQPSQNCLSEAFKLYTRFSCKGYNVEIFSNN